MSIETEPGTAYGVQVLDGHGAGTGWCTMYGFWSEVDPTFIPPDAQESGIERARRCAQRVRDDGREARVVRRTVTVEEVVETLVLDGRGLDPRAVEIVRDQRAVVHARLVAGNSDYPKTACEKLQSLGAWWTGLRSEVTCPACMAALT